MNTQRVQSLYFIILSCLIYSITLTSFPLQMLGGYGEFLYQTGMIDEYQKEYVVKQTDYGVELIQQQKWVEAFKVTAAVRFFMPVSVSIITF